MAKPLRYALIGAAVAGVLFVAASYMMGSNPIMMGAAMMDVIFSRNNPKGTIQIETRSTAQAAERTTPHTHVSAAVNAASTDWSSYNRNVWSDRYSPLADINEKNAGQLKVLCTYDTQRLEASEVSILMVNDAIIGTTTEDIFSIDPSTCKENWRVHENSGLTPWPVNRGPAYWDGTVFRSFADGYVRAFEVATGKKLWETFVGQKDKKIWFTSAPIAWDGMVFFGTSGGDAHNIRGRVFGLDANTGKIVWQTFTVPRQSDDELLAPEGQMPTEDMKAAWRNPPDVPISGGGVWTSETLDPSTGRLYVPVGNPSPDFVKTLRPGSNLFTNTVLVLDAKTGNYIKHHSIMPDDWHDWDVSNPPILYTSRSGRRQLSFHPKDGHLYSYDMATDQQLYRKPVTRIHNADVNFSTEKSVYFCPGGVGGGEWNSPAYDPRHNLLFTGQVEWCSTVKIKPDSEAARKSDGAVWVGAAYVNPYDMFGISDPVSKWAGWLYASDADSGDWSWRAKTNYPIVAAVTPTSGNIVMFGDLGGNFYVLRSADGKQLFHNAFEGGLAGGIITYSIKGQQRIALMAGFAHPAWPIKPTSGKVVVMGL